MDASSVTLHSFANGLAPEHTSALLRIGRIAAHEDHATGTHTRIQAFWQIQSLPLLTYLDTYVLTETEELLLVLRDHVIELERARHLKGKSWGNVNGLIAQLELLDIQVCSLEITILDL